MTQELGARIREARLKSGLSQTELGEPRYSGSYISHIESGRRRPGTDVLGFIAGRLGLAPNDLDPANREFADVDAAALLTTARRMLETHQWDAAVRACESASSIARSAGRDGRWWEADFLLATAQMAAGRYAQAAELAAELMERPVVATISELRAEAGILASRACRASGRLEDAARYAEYAAAIAQQSDPAILASALIAQLSALVTAKSDPQVAPIELRLKSLVDELEDPDVVKVAWALGNTAFSRGDLDDGLAWHTRGAELSDPQVDTRAWARLRQSTAYYLASMGGDVELAQRNFDESRPIISLLGNAGDLADLRLVQARLLLRRDKPHQAAELLEHLREDAAALDDVRLGGEVLESLATARLAMGERDAARAALREAAAHFEAAQAPERALAAWHRFAAIEGD